MIVLNVPISLLHLQYLMLPSSNQANFQAPKTRFRNVVHRISEELFGLPLSVLRSATQFYPSIINPSEPEANTIWLLSVALHASFAILFLSSSKRTDLISLLLRKILKILLDFFHLGYWLFIAGLSKYRLFYWIINSYPVLTIKNKTISYTIDLLAYEMTKYIEKWWNSHNLLVVIVDRHDMYSYVLVYSITTLGSPDRDLMKLSWI